MLLTSKFSINLRKKRKNKSIKKHKKHVETMFLTQKQKTHPYYFKPPIKGVVENNPVNYTPMFKKTFYLRSVTSCYLGPQPLKAVMRICKWFVKIHNLEDFFTFRLHIFPDFVLTSKPKDVRMGKGKGAPCGKIGIVKKGQLIFSLKISDFKKHKFLADLLLKQLIYKLPNKFVVSSHFW